MTEPGTTPPARTPRRARGQLGLVFGLLSAITLVSAWRLLPHFGTSLPSDLGDPILGSWIFWWNAHQTPLTAAWWNAPMFYPMAGTFALSETLLSLWPITTPLQWLGASPVAAHNAAFLLSYPMTGLAMYVLAFRLTRRWDASLIAGVAFAFNPYRIAQLPHIQVQWSCWMPFALAALHWYVDAADAPASAETARSKRLALAAFAACWLLNGFTNGYFLIFFPVLVGCWAVWFVRRWRDALAIGAAAVIASIPIAPMLMGYAARQRAFGFSRGIGEIRTFGADVTAIFAAAPRAWLSSHWTINPGPEGELYPGLAIVVLIAAAIVIAMRRSSADTRWTIGRWTLVGLAAACGALAVIVMATGGSELHLGSVSLSVHRPSRLLTFAFWFGAIAVFTSPTLRRAWTTKSVFAFYVTAAAVMYFFALGPEPHWGATQVLYKPPYEWLMRLPGFNSVRVPARFGLLMLLCLSAAAAIAYARLFALPSRARTALIGVAVLLEGFIVMPVAALPEIIPVPQRILDAKASILEMPVSATFEANTVALYDAMHHARPLVNGFGGYLPPHYYALYLALDTLDPTALDAVRAGGPVGVFVDARRDQPKPEDVEPNAVGSQLKLVSSVPGAELVEKSDRGSWFLLPQKMPPADPIIGTQLKPASVDVTSTPELAAALTDGVPATRWYGAIHGESATDTIGLTFAEPVQPTVVEVDQGQWAGSYARDFEIVAVTETGRVTLYRGSLAEPAIRSAITSANVPIFIPLANAPLARRIELICHPPSKKFTWSVGEIKVYKKVGS